MATPHTFKAALLRKTAIVGMSGLLALSSTGCAMFDDGPRPPRESEAGGPEVASQEAGDNQAWWIALGALLAAGIAAGVAAGSAD